MLLLLLSFAAVSVTAQEPITDDQVNEVAKDLYCPICESTPLDVCPTAACADWREVIRTQLGEGASKQDVLDYFSSRYGDGVLANPTGTDIGRIVLTIIPLLGLLLALLLFVRFLRGVRQEPVGPATANQTPVIMSPTASLDDYIARVEQEVQQ